MALSEEERVNLRDVAVQFMAIGVQRPGQECRLVIENLFVIGNTIVEALDELEELLQFVEERREMIASRKEAKSEKS